jgi:hypothetical protein
VGYVWLVNEGAGVIRVCGTGGAEEENFNV